MQRINLLRNKMMLRTTTHNNNLLNDITICVDLLDTVQKQQRQHLWDTSMDNAKKCDSAVIFDGIICIGLYLDAQELWHRLHTGKSTQGLMTPWSLALKAYSCAHHYLTTPLDNNLANALTDHMTPPDIEKFYSVLEILNINSQLPIPEIKNMLLARLDEERKQCDSKPIDEQYNHHEISSFVLFTDLKKTRKASRNEVNDNDNTNEKKRQQTFN